MSDPPPEVVSIVLRSAAERVRVGERVPVTAEVRNVSTTPFWMVGAVDASEAGLRYPRWTTVVEGPDGRFPPPEGDYYSSPLRPADFRRLEPGEAFDPTSTAGEEAYFPFAGFAAVAAAPGRYTLALELDTRAPDDSAWLGRLPDGRPPQAREEDAAVVRERLAQVPRVRVRSNTLTITVEP